MDFVGELPKKGHEQMFEVKDRFRKNVCGNDLQKDNQGHEAIELFFANV